MNELANIIEQRRLDIVCIQEPYQRSLAWPGFRVFTGVRPQEEMWTLTLVRDNVANVVLIQDCCTPTCTVVRLSVGNSQIILINAYFKYADRIEMHVDHLEMVLRRFRGERTLISADVNARSVLWHNTATDEKGEELEAFIVLHELLVLNCPSEVSTFENTRGQQSNIDVTLGSGSLERLVTDWEVHPEWSLSDHRLITYALDMSQDIRYQGPRESRKSTVRDYDWSLLDASVLTDLGQLRDYDALPLSEKVDSLTGILRRAVEDSAKHKLTGRRLAAWWNDELERFRLNKSRCERRWKRLRNRLGADNALTTGARRLFVIARTAYTNKIRYVKKEHWLRVVRLSGDDDPWGLAYKIMANKLKKPTQMVSMRSGDDVLTTPNEMSIFLGGSFTR